MSLVFAGIMSHGPGMTARADRADPAVRDPFFAALDRLRSELEDSRPDAIIVIAAEHFANFFMTVRWSARAKAISSTMKGRSQSSSGAADDAFLARTRRLTLRV